MRLGNTSVWYADNINHITMFDDEFIDLTRLLKT